MADHLAPNIAMAAPQHLDALKTLADAHKHELGFVNRAILTQAIADSMLLVATHATSGMVIGLLHFYVRRDAAISLYSIVVADGYRRTGVGRALFAALVGHARTLDKTLIRLKCPIDLDANLFYQELGLRKIEEESGKQRALNVWHYTIPAEEKP